MNKSKIKKTNVLNSPIELLAHEIKSITKSTRLLIMAITSANVADISEQIMKNNSKIADISQEIIAIKENMYHKDRITLGNLTVDPFLKTVLVKNKLVHLSPDEFFILNKLAHRAGELVSFNHLGTKESFSQKIYNIRKKCNLGPLIQKKEGKSAILHSS